MRRRRDLLLGLALALPMAALLVAVFLTFTWGYTTVRLELAKREGIYPTAEDAMRAHIARHWRGIERVEIEYAGPNEKDGSDPHVWFVMAKVWAARRGDWTQWVDAGTTRRVHFFSAFERGGCTCRRGHFRSSSASG